MEEKKEVVVGYGRGLRRERQKATSSPEKMLSALSSAIFLSSPLPSPFAAGGAASSSSSDRAIKGFGCGVVLVIVPFFPSQPIFGA